jgi:hypothetical protein
LGGFGYAAPRNFSAPVPAVLFSLAQMGARVPLLLRVRRRLWRTLMKSRDQAKGKSGSKAGANSLAASSAAPKRIAAEKRSAPSRKAAPPKKAAAKKAAPAKKPAAAKKPAPPAPKPAAAAAKAAPAAPAAGQAAARVPGAAAGGTASDERRRAATRRLFARLRSLEAIIGADLRKRGSVVLMQAVDQWYSEAINANATDVSITNAAKTVIAHL